MSKIKQAYDKPKNSTLFYVKENDRVGRKFSRHLRGEPPQGVANEQVVRRGQDMALILFNGVTIYTYFSLTPVKLAVLAQKFNPNFQNSLESRKYYLRTTLGG